LAKRLHVGFGHFKVGYMDGVNMVMLRNVKGLLGLVPDIKITLFGKLNRNIQNFLEPVPGRLEYINIEEFDPDFQVEGFKGRDIQEQHVQDYIWYGSNIADSLRDRLSDLDVVIMENLGIGIHPPLTYAFYQVIRDCNFLAREKRFYYRTHDFVKERQRNFANLKKFHDSPTRNVPDWHEMVYPDFENLHYITINSSDIDRLMEHGISRKQIVYLPNSLGDNMLYDDNEYLNLPNRLVEDKGLDSEVKFLFYPVRCIRRKNVEEAIFLTCFFNCMSGRVYERRKELRIEGKYHLLVGLKPSSNDDRLYAETLIKFCEENHLPVTIGIEDYVGSEREYDPHDPEKIIKYNVGDAYRMADMVITTSILEGFGFVYIEPWCVGTAVIGRDLSLVTEDFNKAGMDLAHLYRVLIVEDTDYKDLGSDLGPQRGLMKRLEMIPRLNDLKFFRKVQGRNEAAITNTLKLFNRDLRQNIINRNQKVVLDTYSQERVAKELYQIIKP